MGCVAEVGELMQIVLKEQGKRKEKMIANNKKKEKKERKIKRKTSGPESSQAINLCKAYQ